MSRLRPLSDRGGAITRLLLAHPGSEDQARKWYGGLLQTLEQLDRDLDLTIVVYPEEGGLVSQSSEPAESVASLYDELYPPRFSASRGGMARLKTVVVVPRFSFRHLWETMVRSSQPGLASCACLENLSEPDLGFRRFVQDPFAVLEQPGGPSVFVEPFQSREMRKGYPSRLAYAGDCWLADELAAKGQYLLRPSRVPFEGGDLLAMGDRLLVGRDVLERALALPGEFEGEGDVGAALMDDFGVGEVIFVGHEEHGLPFRKGLGFQPCYHLDLYLSPAPKPGEILLAEPFPLDLEEDHAEEWDRLVHSLEAVRKQLEAAGIRVKRVPLGVDLEGREPLLYSFNNVLLESNRVFLPEYRGERLEKLRQKAEAAWKMAGATVQWVPGHWVHLAGQGASLRCIVKILARESCAGSAFE